MIKSNLLLLKILLNPSHQGLRWGLPTTKECNEEFFKHLKFGIGRICFKNAFILEAKEEYVAKNGVSSLAFTITFPTQR